MAKEELTHKLQEVNRAILVIRGQAADIADIFEGLKKEADKLILKIDDKLNGDEES